MLHYHLPTCVGSLCEDVAKIVRLQTCNARRRCKRPKTVSYRTRWAEASQCKRTRCSPASHVFTLLQWFVHQGPISIFRGRTQTAELEIIGFTSWAGISFSLALIELQTFFYFILILYEFYHSPFAHCCIHRPPERLEKKIHTAFRETQDIFQQSLS